MGLPQSIPLEQALPDEALPDDIAPERALIELLECKSEDVLRLRSDLGLHPLAAQVLARRGLGEPEAVRAFLAAEELHAPELLPGASAVADSIASHIARGSRIAVHGDYDVDGVCSTAIFVRTLTKLGADVTWHVPSRFEDGYGLSRAAIDRLGRDGVDLMIAVDCGVTAVNETAYAKAQGMDVVICDHHKSDDTLPDALIAHPALGDYPFPDLCAAAVAYKVCQLVAERTGGDAAALQDDLELVGLATVCDVMPLSGENRTLVRRGIAAMRQTMRPGLRELMRSSAVDQLKVDAGAFGFRLGPRINAAGRMFSAEPAVELLLTTSEQRAAELAAQLGSANSRRQEIEQTILFQAETQARRQRDEFAIVVAGDDWHGGVLGIVAGRIAERFRRPCIALGIEGGVAKGSGRSGGVYDLHSGLTACSSHLTRFGGHKAAAGVELEETAINAFRVALQAHAREHLTADDLRPRVRVDAVADPSQLSLEAVEALEQLGPFGMGNPEPNLLIAGADVTTLKRMGDGGKHFRLGISARGGRSGLVAFSWPGEILYGDDAPAANLVVKLKRNEWRGVVEAQSRLVAFAAIEPDGDSAIPETDSDSEWLMQFDAAIAAPNPQPGAGGTLNVESAIDRRGDSPLGVVVELVEDCASVIMLVNDPTHWRSSLAALAALDRRFAEVRCLAYSDPEACVPAPHALLAEPPFAPSCVTAAHQRVTLAWNDGLVRFATARAAEQLVTREHVKSAYKAVTTASQSRSDGFAALREALPTAALAAKSAIILEEVGLFKLIRGGESVESIEVVDGPRTELDRSATFRAYSALREESTQWLASLTPET